MTQRIRIYWWCFGAARISLPDEPTSAVHRRRERPEGLRGRQPPWLPGAPILGRPRGDLQRRGGSDRPLSRDRRRDHDRALWLVGGRGLRARRRPQCLPGRDHLRAPSTPSCQQLRVARRPVSAQLGGVGRKPCSQAGTFALPTGPGVTCDTRSAHAISLWGAHGSCQWNRSASQV